MIRTGLKTAPTCPLLEGLACRAIAPATPLLHAHLPQSWACYWCMSAPAPPAPVWWVHSVQHCCWIVEAASSTFLSTGSGVVVRPQLCDCRLSCNSHVTAGCHVTVMWLQVVMWQSCDYRLSCDSHVTAGFATLITMFPQVLWGIWSTITLVSCWQAANSSFSSSASETESCNKPEHIEMLNGFYCAIIVCWRN